MRSLTFCASSAKEEQNGNLKTIIKCKQKMNELWLKNNLPSPVEFCDQSLYVLFAAIFTQTLSFPLRGSLVRTLYIMCLYVAG